MDQFTTDNLKKLMKEKNNWWLYLPKNQKLTDEHIKIITDDMIADKCNYYDAEDDKYYPVGLFALGAKHSQSVVDYLVETKPANYQKILRGEQNILLPADVFNELNNDKTFYKWVDNTPQTNPESKCTFSSRSHAVDEWHQHKHNPKWQLHRITIPPIPNNKVICKYGSCQADVIDLQEQWRILDI